MIKMKKNEKPNLILQTRTQKSNMFFSLSILFLTRTFFNLLSVSSLKKKRKKNFFRRKKLVGQNEILLPCVFLPDKFVGQISLREILPDENNKLLSKSTLGDWFSDDIFVEQKCIDQLCSTHLTCPTKLFQWAKFYFI